MLYAAEMWRPPVRSMGRGPDFAGWARLLMRTGNETTELHGECARVYFSSTNVHFIFFLF